MLQTTSAPMSIFDYQKTIATMKKLLLFVMLGTLSTTGAFAQQAKSFGKKFKTEAAFPAGELNQRIGDKAELKDVTVSGTITEVCQAAGCWVKLKNEAGEDVFVKFQDGKISVPKDMAGHKAIVHGTAVRKTVSVEQQRHFAEDAGKSADEIAQITEPKTSVRINSNGVVIY